MNWLHTNKAYITGAFVALVAFNSATGLIPQEVMSVILAIGAALGYYTGQGPSDPTSPSNVAARLRQAGVVVLAILLFAPAPAQAQIFGYWRGRYDEANRSQRQQQAAPPAPAAPAADPNTAVIASQLQSLNFTHQQIAAALQAIAQQQGQKASPTPAAPAAPAAPQIIYLSPQGQGTPSSPQIIYLPQQIPLGGPPAQQIPLGGPPAQQIPLGGPPQQLIPLGPPPQQQIPLGSKPQQQIPLGSPAAPAAPPVASPTPQIPLGAPPATPALPVQPSPSPMPAPVPQQIIPLSKPPAAGFQRYAVWR